MFQTLQQQKAFHFSLLFDLSTNLQRQSEQKAQIYPNSVGNQPHYTFNDSLLKEFQGDQFAPYRTPCIYGFFQ